jgi:hypothetical protein
LHEFADNAAVIDALYGLIEREGEPLVVKLPRAPGRKDSEYMHLFCGPVDIEKHARDSEAATSDRSRDRASVTELAERVSALEAELAELKDLLKPIR